MSGIKKGMSDMTEEEVQEYWRMERLRELELDWEAEMKAESEFPQVPIKKLGSTTIVKQSEIGAILDGKKIESNDVEMPPQYLILCDWSSSQIFFHKLTWEDACKCKVDEDYKFDYIDDYQKAINQNHSNIDWIFAYNLNIFFTNLSRNEIKEAIDLESYPENEILFTDENNNIEEYE